MDTSSAIVFVVVVYFGVRVAVALVEKSKR